MPILFQAIDCDQFTYPRSESASVHFNLSGADAGTFVCHPMQNDEALNHSRRASSAVCIMGHVTDKAPLAMFCFQMYAVHQVSLQTQIRKLDPILVDCSIKQERHANASATARRCSRKHRCWQLSKHRRQFFGGYSFIAPPICVASTNQELNLAQLYSML